MESEGIKPSLVTALARVRYLVLVCGSVGGFLWVLHKMPSAPSRICFINSVSFLCNQSKINTIIMVEQIGLGKQCRPRSRGAV